MCYFMYLASPAIGHANCWNKKQKACSIEDILTIRVA